MISEEQAKEILRSIGLTGAASAENAKVIPILKGNMSHILNLSSGSPRLHHSIVKRFRLIIETPLSLVALNPFEIRCCLCNKIISYPCWYYQIRYAVNHFHYFVCFDKLNNNRPTTCCYRKG